MPGRCATFMTWRSAWSWTMSSIISREANTRPGTSIPPVFGISHAISWTCEREIPSNRTGASFPPVRGRRRADADRGRRGGPRPAGPRCGAGGGTSGGSRPVPETVCEFRREPRVEHFPARRLDVVRYADPGHLSGFRVVQEKGGIAVPVPRLSDAAGVEGSPRSCRETDPPRGARCHPAVLPSHEPARDMRVAEEDRPFRRGGEEGRKLLLRLFCG